VLFHHGRQDDQASWWRMAFVRWKLGFAVGEGAERCSKQMGPSDIASPDQQTVSPKKNAPPSRGRRADG